MLKEVFLSCSNAGTAWSAIENGEYCIPVMAILHKSAGGFPDANRCMVISKIYRNGGHKND